MRLQVAKWGNSLAVRLPAHLTQETRLEEGAAVEVEAKDGSIVLTPVRKKMKLADLLAGVPSRKDGGSAEHDWGKPEGDEAW